MNEPQHGEKSMASTKKRSNDRKAISILYPSIMVAITLAVGVQAMDESKNSLTAVVHDLMLGTLFASGAAILSSMTVYFYLQRYKTFEAAHKSVSSIPFIVKYSRCGEHVNLYLRLGLLMFTIMSIGQSFVKFVQLANNPKYRWPEVYKSMFELAFYICQTSFILINHRIVILHNNAIFGACLMHVLNTNLCMWADITLEKIYTTLKLDKKEDNKNYTSTYENVKNPQFEAAKKFSFYLLPAVSEYCLLSAALIYEITVRIGEPSYIELEEDHHEHRSRKERTIGWLEKIKSGYWSPLMIVLMITLLTIATGASPKPEKISVWKCSLLFTEEMILYSFGIAVTILASIKVRDLKFTVALRQSVIDEFLLYIAFFFSANYLVANISLTSFVKRADDYSATHQDLLMIRLILDTLELAQIIMQTYMIQDCFRRCSEEEIQQRLKPARQLIGVLLAINLAGWVVKSFQMKEADIIYGISDDSGYGRVLIAISLPVYLFYRYHCTVCLSQAFTLLYEDETRRFEALWRQNPMYLANLVSNTNLGFCRNCHLHADENIGFGKNSQSDINHQYKFARENIPIQGLYQKSSSFFHPCVIDLTQCDTQLDISSHAQNFSEIHHDKISIPCPQEKISLSTFKKGSMTNDNPGHENSHQGLHDSESFEGPNYFLSRKQNTALVMQPDLSNVKANEQATQTALGLYQCNEHGKFANSSSHPYNLHTHTSHIVSRKKSRLKSRPEMEENAGLGGTMKRRQTLVNLETAKYRFLAAELTNRRILERANNPHVNGIFGKKEKKIKIPKTKMSKYSLRRRSEDVLNKIGTPQTLNRLHIDSNFSVKDTSQLPTSPGLEPAKILPLVIASNRIPEQLLNTVPEESCDSKSSDFSHDSRFTSANEILSPTALHSNDEKYSNKASQKSSSRMDNTGDVDANNLQYVV